MAKDKDGFEETTMDAETPLELARRDVREDQKRIRRQNETLQFRSWSGSA
jgi:hypothetical protein